MQRIRCLSDSDSRLSLTAAVRSHFCLIMLGAACLLWLVAPAWGQIAPVQVTPCGATSLPGPPCSIAATGSAHLLVVGIQMMPPPSSPAGTATPGVATIVDDVRNQYVQVPGSRAVDPNTGKAVEIWYARRSTPGATAVTITPTSAAFAGAVVWEFSGVDFNSPLDQVATLVYPSPAVAVQAPSVTLGSPQEVVISVSAAQNPVSGSVSGSFINDASVFNGGWAHLFTTVSGAYSPAWTQSLPGTYASTTVSFKSLQITTSCDINGDGRVNALDVQLMANMEIPAPGFSCSANVGGVLSCSEAARRVVIKAALTQSCHFITLTWGASPSAGVTGYNIYRGTSPGGESPTPINTKGPVPDLTFTDVDTVAGKGYFYIIKATNGTMESLASDEVSATAF